ALAQRGDFEKLNAPSANGNTALHLAARHGHPAACEALLECPGLASLNGQNSSGWTVLHYAAAAGMVNVCEKILRHPQFSADGALTANGDRTRRSTGPPGTGTRRSAKCSWTTSTDKTECEAVQHLAERLPLPGDAYVHTRVHSCPASTLLCFPLSW
ncbi:unnamed protein product, partial [Prorocentrum cordatum]